MTHSEKALIIAAHVSLGGLDVIRPRLTVLMMVEHQWGWSLMKEIYITFVP